MEKHNHDAGKISPEKFNAIVENQAVRRAITRACHFLFFHIYFPHHIKYQTAKFQKELFALSEDTSIPTVVIEAFRGSGKTTIMGTSYPIWSILGSQQRKFVLILAQTDSQAKQYLANIKSELENNELLRTDLGPFEEPDDEWRANSIVLPKYGARITVASSGASVRGLKHRQHRPDLIICDDLEDLETAKTQEGRDKIYKWLTGDVIPAGDKATRLIVIGNRFHHDSLIMQLRKEIREGRMNGVAKSYPFLNEKNVVAWPSKYATKAEVNALKKSQPNKQAWEREYLLHIISDKEQVVKSEWIQYYDSLPSDDVSFRYSAMGVDPAISEKETADFTAIVLGRIYGKRNNLKVYIQPNPINARMSFLKTVEKIESVFKTLSSVSPTRLWIESVAFQKSLVQQLNSLGCPAKESKQQGSDKHARLMLVSMHIQSGKILFPRTGSEKHDDLVDAFCILVLSILDQESHTLKGYTALLTEAQVNEAYIEIQPPTAGEKRLGVVRMGGSRNYSTIVFRDSMSAQVLYREPVDDTSVLAKKVIGFAKEYEVSFSDKQIFIDVAGMGQELCSKIKELVSNDYNQIRLYEYDQNYSTNLGNSAYKGEPYADLRARGYWKLGEWIRAGGKLFGKLEFDELLEIQYTDTQGNTIQIIDKEKLLEEGIDSSVPDALALTFVVDKQPELHLEPGYDPSEIDERSGYFRV
jgi:hypothetical protein